MNYLIFACIGLSIVVLISLFITLEKIQQGIDNIENTMDWVKRSTDNLPYIDSDIIHQIRDDVITIKSILTESKKTEE